ncbi:glycosyltransferase family 4 protein [Clostridium tagluense]|uniref:glycosyltransferase family 4 protein n=1 Tax=Clostridium tagluense TaxID=360422 RepID=UPI001CF14D6F|nr:glycosyltransferase family 4 protein [Clostridium tagluense]MCB2312023.1 glycosyltransferase family 4 protein [Clostridium tagluense]MCB2316610.1 glycosyltransferase family 4 protein [Clostridium tagluense]MCB2321454.1 glycosyltransferase family 4 protein [Clostridium tagluense]MCB2326466.1 glycosyltransferase family 4 protein [Clostridium tagluense]MCB2331202.1 glycosyltransferase family 4 protein [Clostridium tagluense]
MKKMLMIVSVASMIDQFNMPNIDILKKQGYEVHVAANFEYGSTSSKERVEELKKELTGLNVQYYHVDFSRKIKNVSENIKAYKQIKNLMLKNEYDFVHCQSPIGGFCGRLAANNTNTTVIYTAHGFHFFKGAPLLNWILYYPVEKLLAHYTDVLITINKEDYARAKKSFKAGKIKYIPGVGIDTKKFNEVIVDKLAKRKELEVPEDGFVILSVGELNKNKNHETVIKSLAKLNNPNVYYVICGQGILENYLKNLLKKLGLEKQVKLLGYRRDVAEISKASDVFVFPSVREGLPVALMEGMALGLPVVCSNIRGNIDLIEDYKGGYLVAPDDVDGFTEAIHEIIQKYSLRENMGEYNKESIVKFDIDNVKVSMEKIYFDAEYFVN